MNVRNWKAILVAGLISISQASCLYNPPRHPAPTKPILQIIAQADGGFCVDKASAIKLGVYILEMERALK